MQGLELPDYGPHVQIDTIRRLGVDVKKILCINLLKTKLRAYS
jgi:hypothetical protein